MDRDLVNKAVGNLAVRPASPPSQCPTEPYSTAVKPALVDKEADYALPRRLFTAWIPDVGPREIRRELTAAERGILARRAGELQAGLRPFAPNEDRDVERQIAGMLSGFRSLARLDQAEARFTIGVTRQVLREFPFWAIAKACEKVATKQVPDLDPAFPPNDNQLHEICSRIVADYRKTLATVEALLAAPVETPTPVPTRGSSASDRGHASIDPSLPDKPVVKPGYRARVEADLANRRRIPLPGEAQGSGSEGAAA